MINLDTPEAREKACALLNKVFKYENGVLYWKNPYVKYLRGKVAGCEHKYGFWYIKCAPVFGDKYVLRARVVAYMHGIFPGDDMLPLYANGQHNDDNISNISWIPRKTAADMRAYKARTLPKGVYFFECGHPKDKGYVRAYSTYFKTPKGLTLKKSFSALKYGEDGAKEAAIRTIESWKEKFSNL